MKVELYTDGSCDTTTGAGGWAYLIKCNGRESRYSGGESETTNNRMELTAVIKGLESLQRPCEITLFSDSKYVLDGIRFWLPNWKKKGWQKSDKKPVKNQDLWMRIDELKRYHNKMLCIWIKGHNNHFENEQVDSMAHKARR